MGNKKNHNRRHKRINKTAIVFIISLAALAVVSTAAYFLLRTPEKEERKSGGEKKQEASADAQEETSQKEMPQEDPLEGEVQETLAGMTLEEKVAQLFFITPEALTGVEKAVQAGDTTRECLEKYPVGGIIYFQQNITGEEQLKTMIANTKSYSKYPIFIGVDEEGGSLVARIANSGVIDVPKVPDMAQVGAGKDTARAYEVGKTLGTYLSELGFNVDFAPDSDVLTNPGNKAIGIRSFGSDPEMVAGMVEQEVKGLQECKVSAVLKHFPGHGDTIADSHNGKAESTRTMEQLESCEFLPFQAGIEAGADFVMVGHISLNNALGDDTPASINEKVVQGILRDKWNYDGIVITDSLAMGAVTEYYGPKEAAVKVLQSGGDMMLMPQDFAQAYEGVLEAVQNGTVSEERIDESVCRILRVKLR